jgi:LmeA-like phospholipid-binding
VKGVTGVSPDPTRPISTGWQPQHSAAQHQYEGRRRRRFPLKTVIAIIILLLLLVGADRVAAAVAEGKVASKIQSSMSLSGKPSVDIEGFPFLTQLLISRDLRTVVITGHDLSDGKLDFTNFNATASNVRIHSGFKSATVDSFNGSVTVTLSSVASAGDIPSGITFAPDGPNMVKASVKVLGFDATATARVTVQDADHIRVQVIDAGGIPVSALGNAADFSVAVPGLPSGVSLTGVNVTSAGVQVSFSGTNTTLGQ